MISIPRNQVIVNEHGMVWWKNNMMMISAEEHNKRLDKMAEETRKIIERNSRMLDDVAAQLKADFDVCIRKWVLKSFTVGFIVGMAFASVCWFFGKIL